MNIQPTGYSKAFFWILFILIASNFLSLSVAGFYIPSLRYFRQVALVLDIIFLLHFLPKIKVKGDFFSIRLVFFAFVFYLTFNIISSIDPLASLNQGVWAVTLLIFIYHLIIERCEYDFRITLQQFISIFLIISQVLVIISFFGAYVLDWEIFFDDRFNYTLGKMTREFAGVFGSNNVMGILTFMVQVFYLIYHRIRSEKRFSVWLLLAVIHSLLLTFIGNRSSMGCSVLMWLFYFIYVNRSIAASLQMVVAGALIFFTSSELILSSLRLEQFEDGKMFGNRSHLVKEGVEVIEKMDFFGVGYYNQKLSRIALEVETETEKPLNFHNTYLAVATELGFLGLLWIPGFILYMIFKNPESKSDSQKRVLIRMLKSFFLVLLLLYLTVEDSVNSPGSVIFPTFWTMFLILVKGLYEPEDQNLKV